MEGALTAKIIDGKQVAAEIYQELEKDIVALKETYEIVPGIAVILVGSNPGSLVYVRSKKRMCDRLGIYAEEHVLPTATTTGELLQLIEDLNQDPKIHGILVQLPLPGGIDSVQVLRSISPYKDVDGFHPENVGSLLIGEPRFISCTPLGIQHLLVRSGVQISGSHVVIIGRSNIVGKPLAAILMQKRDNANATVTICHSRSKDLKKLTRQADIVIAAMGSPEFVTADYVRKGAVVIDVGTNRVTDTSSPKGYRIVGDVNFGSVSEKAGYITKVPGGVGPMTICMLMYNTVQAAEHAVKE